MSALLTKIISAVIIPLFTFQYSPLFLTAKIFNSPSEPVSLVENNISATVVAHRGGTTEAPENSLPAFRNAIENNYYAAECDIMRTTDGRWVITHDEEVYKHFFGTGKFTEMTFDEARKYQYAFSTNYWKYADERIPSLEEYLDLFINSKTRPQIEIKCDGTEGLDYVVKALKDRNLLNKAIIISFDIEQLREINRLNSSIEIWYLVRGIDEENIAEAKSINSCTVISADNGYNNEKSIKLAIDNGFDVAIWTIDNISKAERFCSYGVKYIVSNKLAP